MHYYNMGRNLSMDHNQHHTYRNQYMYHNHQMDHISYMDHNHHHMDHNYHRHMDHNDHNMGHMDQFKDPHNQHHMRLHWRHVDGHQAQTMDRHHLSHRNMVILGQLNMYKGVMKVQLTQDSGHSTLLHLHAMPNPTIPQSIWLILLVTGLRLNRKQHDYHHLGMGEEKDIARGEEEEENPRLRMQMALMPQEQARMLIPLSRHQASGPLNWKPVGSKT